MNAPLRGAHCNRDAENRAEGILALIGENRRFLICMEQGIHSVTHHHA